MFYVAERGACVSYTNRRIRVGKGRQRADVRGWNGQACEIVVCAGGVQDSGEAFRTAFFACVVLVQLGVCAKMIDEVLQFVRGGRPRFGVGESQFVREVKRERDTMQ